LLKNQEKIRGGKDDSAVNQGNERLWECTADSGEDYSLEKPDSGRVHELDAWRALKRRKKKGG